ncbi:MAG: hypothetical protein IT392_12885 [Nitrospirae bacterium]|nr:hypothetical protein [Nitrospirota bacterium]
MKKFTNIVMVAILVALLVPAFSAAEEMNGDQTMPLSHSMDEKGMEEMHKMMPRMMRNMMEMMQEMMGMMKGTVSEEKDREKLEGMMQHMERMMKGYDETLKGAGNEKMSEATRSGPISKSDEAGGVTIAVTYLNPGEGGPAFEIKLDTHSVDLEQYKLENMASLRDDTGKEYGIPVMESPSGSGHHRAGILRFKGVDISRLKAIELVIKDVVGVKERVFRFEIKK